MASIIEDIKFAEESIGGEFPSVASMLRYVAAINAEATRKEFVEACVAAGYKANTATNRFYESRKAWIQDFGGTMDKEGRYHEA